MKATCLVLIVFTLCAINGAVSPRTTAAVSYVPHNVTEQPNIIDTTMHKQSGATVYLFHGATHEIIQLLAGHELCSVSRISCGMSVRKAYRWKDTRYEISRKPSSRGGGH